MTATKASYPLEAARPAAPLEALRRDDPVGAASLAEKGDQLYYRGNYPQARDFYRQALELSPGRAMTYNNLALIEEGLGNNAEAVANYRAALRLDPRLQSSRRNLATLLVHLGRRDESLRLWYGELSSGSVGRAWIQDCISTSMGQRDLSFAGDVAAIFAQLRRASPWFPPESDRAQLTIPVDTPDSFFTIPKLEHDIEQLEYLLRRGILGPDFTHVIGGYEKVIARLSATGADRRTPLGPEDRKEFGHVFNRIVYHRPTPRVSRALSSAWKRSDIEQQFIESNPGIVLVDNFLSEEALTEVRQFCLESTVWFANRYAHGRLGAFFYDGFNCPLLLQIAEELREAFPRLIGDKYPLRQLWGFKNARTLPADSTNHADFAAVNVNFWITPDDANLDPSSGGLVVYDVDAPLSWDFNTYNGRTDIIKPYLKEQRARAINIPYKQNRALIFDSDLFHSTAEVNFRPGYENRRINITMLYGTREDDVHHRSPTPQQQKREAAWRSAAFALARSPRAG